MPAGTIGDPDDFGRVIAFLCSTSAAYITGAALPVDGGVVRRASMRTTEGVRP